MLLQAFAQCETVAVLFKIAKYRRDIVDGPLNYGNRRRLDLFFHTLGPGQRIGAYTHYYTTKQQ